MFFESNELLLTSYLFVIGLILIKSDILKTNNLYNNFKKLKDAKRHSKIFR